MTVSSMKQLWKLGELSLHITLHGRKCRGKCLVFETRTVCFIVKSEGGIVLRAAVRWWLLSAIKIKRKCQYDMNYIRFTWLHFIKLMQNKALYKNQSFIDRQYLGLYFRWKQLIYYEWVIFQYLDSKFKTPLSKVLNLTSTRPTAHLKLSKHW